MRRARGVRIQNHSICASCVRSWERATSAILHSMMWPSLPHASARGGESEARRRTASGSRSNVPRGRGSISLSLGSAALVPSLLPPMNREGSVFRFLSLLGCRIYRCSGNVTYQSVCGVTCWAWPKLKMSVDISPEADSGLVSNLCEWDWAKCLSVLRQIQA
jgi:hypothetical protein